MMPPALAAYTAMAWFASAKCGFTSLRSAIARSVSR
jgi:hypothetical protein